jgi:hypothetical protein
MNFSAHTVKGHREFLDPVFQCSLRWEIQLSANGREQTTSALSLIGVSFFGAPITTSCREFERTAQTLCYDVLKVQRNLRRLSSAINAAFNSGIDAPETMLVAE